MLFCLHCDSLKVPIQYFPRYKRRTGKEKELYKREPWFGSTKHLRFIGIIFRHTSRKSVSSVTLGSLLGRSWRLYTHSFGRVLRSESTVDGVDNVPRSVRQGCFRTGLNSIHSFYLQHKFRWLKTQYIGIYCSCLRRCVGLVSTGSLHHHSPLWCLSDVKPTMWTSIRNTSFYSPGSKFIHTWMPLSFTGPVK